MSLKVKQEQFYRWSALSLAAKVMGGLPKTLAEYSRQNDVRYRTLEYWKAKAEENPVVVPAGVRVEVSPEQQKIDYMTKLYAEAMQIGAPAKKMELFATLMKWMPKTNLDIKIGLSADEIARRNLEATKQLEEGGYGSSPSN